MGLVDQRRVEEAFGLADAYSTHARVQRRIAASLAERIGQLSLPREPRILEIGCGTGFLTQELISRGATGEWMITDKSAAMVARCRKTIGEGESRRFAVLDGEYGLDDCAGEFDLICSSMTMQWFDDLPRAVHSLCGHLAGGGHLVFNTLASSTFQEWRDAHRAHGLAAGGPDYPSVSRFREQMGTLPRLAIDVEHYLEEHRDAREFLLALKQIGASTARSDHTPLVPRDLRRVMREFEARGSRVTYEVLVCHLTNVGRS